jgi:hypothetical protein
MPRKAQSPLTRTDEGPQGNGATVVCLGPVQPPHERDYGKFCPLCEWRAFKDENA